MKLRADILRRQKSGDAPYIQSFWYEPEDENETAADMLNKLNARTPLIDADGNEALPIRFECSCLQRKCGACAMVINGVPSLACDAVLSSYKNKIRLEPLGKFPVIADLIVDRSIVFEQLKNINLWLERNVLPKQETVDIRYEASRCLQCGCCLEVCPNYMSGGEFYGMSSAIPMSRLMAELPLSDIKQRGLDKDYKEKIYEGCGKSLACRNICPAKIEIENLMVNSNAVAIWRRLIKEKTL